MSFRFDRDKLFDGLRKWEGPLSPQQVVGINFILDAVGLDKYVTRVEWLAYMLATTKHETADTYQPIHEYGGKQYFIRRYGSQTRVGRQLGNDTPEEGALYAGVGDVQLTGETNFEKAETAVLTQYPELVRAFEARTGRKFDLTVGDQPNDELDPQNAGDPAIAYAIMSYGMRTGMFTTRNLARYFNASENDPYNARKIINGLDHADLIAGYYRHWLVILKASVISGGQQFNDAEINELTAGIGQTSTATGPAGSEASLPVKPALHTVGSPEPEADVVQLADADGDGGADARRETGDAEIRQTETIAEDGSKTTETSLSAPAEETPGVMDHLKSLGDKYLNVQAQFDKFGIQNPLANTSVGTYLFTAAKFIFGAIMSVCGVIYNNPIFFIVSLALIGFAVWLFNESRKRVAVEKAGIPKEIVEKLVPPESYPDTEPRPRPPQENR